MDLRKFYSISLCYIVYHSAYGFSVLKEQTEDVATFNHSASEDLCIKQGGLASYEHAAERIRLNTDEGQSLYNGESAWIAGTVEFSEFVSWHGCYSEGKEKILKLSLTDNNIYNCLESCANRSNITYIGIQKEHCYCLSWEHISYGYFNVKPDSNCDQQPLRSNLYTNDSSSSNINVFTIIDNRTLFWDPPVSDARGQCVYIRGNKARHVTGSCFTPTNGFICIGSASRPLSEECHRYNDITDRTTLPFCFVFKNSSWLSSFKECGGYSGKLPGTVLPAMKEQMNPKENIWTGIFRSFKVRMKESSKKGRICLSIKKFEDKLVLDPADCLEKKRFICDESSSERKSSTTIKKTHSEKETDLVTEISYTTTALTKKYTGHITTLNKETDDGATATFVSTNSYEETKVRKRINYLTTTVPKITVHTIPTITMTTKMKESTDGKEEPKGIYIAVALSVVLTLILTIVIACLIMRKRRKMRNGGSRVKSNSNDQPGTAAYNFDIHTRPATASYDFEEGQVLIHQQNDTKAEVEYAVPNKGLGQRNKIYGEYDSVNVNTGKPNQNATSVESEAANIYFRTGCEGETDNYDHLRAVGTKQFTKPIDGIYNTMAAECNTYNVLRSGNEAKSTVDKQPHIMDNVNNTYDKVV